MSVSQANSWETDGVPHEFAENGRDTTRVVRMREGKAASSLKKPEVIAFLLRRSIRASSFLHIRHMHTITHPYLMYVRLHGRVCTHGLKTGSSLTEK